MNISIRPELERFVEDLVQTGHYPTPEAVIEDALTKLQGDQPAWTIENLREEINRGIASLDRGEGIVLDSKEELRAYFESKIKVLHRPADE